MSDIIRLLPDSVANQIAAGEVIQRPSSVIKELVENAVDAAATEINIFVKDAGRTLIQVIDNGRGMSETDARMAIERHATSKISKADDIFSLRSMGFRGEALPSVCAISQMEIKTRTADAPVGTLLQTEASKVVSQEPCVCECGTSISVRNLFFNVPARRKFLKSDNVELSNIMREFERLALVNNAIRMTLDTGTRIIDLPAASFRQRIGDIWKNNLKEQILPVEVDTALVKISGYVSRPEYARRRHPLQYLIVNGRNMRHPYFHKALLSCYDNLIAVDTQPCYFIKFEVDPASIDVNIHPTKNEIKFEYEQQIWPILVAAVKSSLGRFAAVPSIDFESDVLPVSPLAPGQSPQAPDIGAQAAYNPFSPSSDLASGPQDTETPECPDTTDPGIPSDPSQLDFNPDFGNATPHHFDFGMQNPGPKSSAGYRRHPDRDKTDNWESLYRGFMSQTRQEASDSDHDRLRPGLFDAEAPHGPLQPAPICLQYALKYIVTPSRDGLMVIDQHRAHVRVLYEEYMHAARSSQRVAHPVLFPETIALDRSQENTLSSILPTLAALGYTLQRRQAGQWAITSTPPPRRGDPEPRDIILRMLDSVSDDEVNYGTEAFPLQSMTERTALLMARSTAITRGRKLSSEEMEHLIGELFRLPESSLTPDGRRIYTILSENQLESLLP